MLRIRTKTTFFDDIYTMRKPSHLTRYKRRTPTRATRRRSLILPDEMQRLYSMNNKLVHTVKTLIQEVHTPIQDRLFRSLDFSGRTRKNQKFSIVSFPGKYEREWIKMTTGEDKMVKKSCITASQ